MTGAGQARNPNGEAKHGMVVAAGGQLVKGSAAQKPPLPTPANAWVSCRAADPAHFPIFHFTPKAGRPTAPAAFTHHNK
jgi:hypothetical protein